MCYSEDTKLFVDIALREYSELRSELRDNISKQFTVISATFTIVASLFTLGVKLMTDAIGKEFVSMIFYVIIPCFCMFSGILWIDYVYRQVKMGTYISQVETKVNKKFVNDDEIYDMDKCPLFWEHYADKEADNKFFFKVNHWNYYFTMALYLMLPAVSVAYLLFVKKGKWYAWCNITPVIFVFFMIFLLGYLMNIANQIKIINGVSLFTDKKECKPEDAKPETQKEMAKI